MKSLFITLGLISFCFQSGYTQGLKDHKTDSTTAHSFYKNGESFLIKNEYDSAIFWFSKGEELFEKSTSWNMHFWCQVKITQCYIDLRDFDKAAKIGEKIAPESVEKLGKNNAAEAGIYNVLGNLFVYGKSEFDKGIEYYLKSANTQKQISEGKSSVPLASALNNLGLAYWKIGRYNKATQYFDETLVILKELLGENHAYVSFTYNNIALVLWEKGSYEKALEYYQKALVIFNQTLGDDNPKLASIYDNIGLVYGEMGKFKLALENYNKALKIYDKNSGKNESIIAGTLNNIGFAYEKMNDYDQALKYHQNALKIRKKLLKDNNPLKADSYQNVGSSFYKKGNYDLALQNYSKSLEIRKAAFGNKSPFIAASYNTIGILYDTLGNDQLALQSFQKALSANYPDYNDSTNIYSSPKLENYYNPKYLLESLKYKAMVLSAAKERKDMDFGIVNYKLCDQLIDKIRNSYSKENDKVKLASKADEIYKSAVETCYKLYAQTKERQYLNEAFYFMEKNKANVLLSTINESKAKLFTGIPDSLLQKEKDIKSDISFYIQQIASKPDSTWAAECRIRLFSLSRNHEALIRIFEKNYPKYFQLKYQNSFLSLDGIQNNLSDNTSLVEYLVDEHIVYAMVFTKSTVRLNKLPVRELASEIQSLQKGIKEDKFTIYSKAAFNLYSVLIEPLKIKVLEQGPSNLIIIPDGVLWNLNFEILLKQNPKDADYRQCHYLIKDHTVYYANSATLLNQKVDSKLPSAKNECLAFSYNNEEQTNSGNYVAMRGAGNSMMIDLPGTRKEISSISEVMEGTYYFGSFASEKNFKKNAKDFKILHLALHGEIDDENPMNSKLFFSNDNDSIEDNFLHSYELYNIELNAELAVLSACNTGSGKIVKGEGIMSLGRAFIYAGCKSLLMSQWELSDYFTPDLMKDYYQNLKEGKSKAEALRIAKINHLNQADNISSNPYYWAPLVHLGDNSPLPKNNYMMWVIAGLVILSVLVSTRFVFRK